MPYCPLEASLLELLVMVLQVFSSLQSAQPSVDKQPLSSTVSEHYTLKGQNSKWKIHPDRTEEKVPSSNLWAYRTTRFGLSSQMIVHKGSLYSESLTAAGFSTNKDLSNVRSGFSRNASKSLHLSL